jgi:RNA polymerase-binding transcription factor DksA
MKPAPTPSTNRRRASDRSAIAAEQEITLQRLLRQRRKLLRLRAAIARRIKQLADEAREEKPGYSEHMADAATDSIDRDLALGLVSFEQDALYEVDSALKRIDDGTYGICELTGKPISWKRLRAIPWTRFSLQAEAQLEDNMHPHIGALGAIRPDELARSSFGIADSRARLACRAYGEGPL